MLVSNRYPVISRALERFRSDYRRRYPRAIPASESGPAMSATHGENEPQDHRVRLGRLSTEIGIVLILVGTAGVLLPGPIGSPFLVAGVIALWPAALRAVERWLSESAPRIYVRWIRWIERFLADLERRYPGSTW
jgi:hypothetical protein